MALGKDELTELYRKRARLYDWSAQLYYLIGFREWAYRKEAIRALRLVPGATVVEIGCGTGLNFSLLRKEVGETGRIIGVDLTDEMLRRRVIESSGTVAQLRARPMRRCLLLVPRESGRHSLHLRADARSGVRRGRCQGCPRPPQGRSVGRR